MNNVKQQSQSKKMQPKAARTIVSVNVPQVGGAKPVKRNRGRNRVRVNPSMGAAKSANDESALNQVKILSALTKPEHCRIYGVPRYNDGTSQPTAVASPVRLETLLSAQMKEEQQVFLFRNPAVNMIIPQYAPNGATWRYDAYMDSIQATSNPVLNPLFELSDNFGFIPLLPAYWKNNASSTWQKHGDYFLCGESKCSPGSRFVWLDAGETVELSVTTDINETVTLLGDRDNGGKLEPNFVYVTEACSLGIGKSLVIPILSRGYYAFRLTTTEQVATDIQVNYLKFFDTAGTATTQAARHLCMKNYCDNLSTWPSLRYLGGTLRYCNTASVLNLAGNVAIADIPARKDWQDYDSYDAVSSINGAFRDDVREGGFGRLSIANRPVDFEMQENTEVNNGTVLDSHWPVEPTSSFLAFSIQITDSASRQGFLEQWSAVEFQTTDTSRELANTTIPAEDWTAAIQKTAAIPSKTKNAIHLKDIGKAISSVAKGTVRSVLKYGPQVVEGVGTAMGIAAAVGAFL